MKRERASRKLHKIVTFDYILNLILNSLAILGCLIFHKSFDSPWLCGAAIYGCLFIIHCWRLAYNATYEIDKNAKRIIELEELLAKHGIEFPKEEIITPKPIADVESKVEVLSNETDSATPEIEECDDTEYKKYAEEIDRLYKREVMELLAAGKDMKALLLLTNSGIPMEVAAEYIEQLSTK